MRSQLKITFGSGLAALAGAAMAATPVLGLSSAAQSMIFVSGILLGILAGIGATMAVHGLIQRRQAR
jgi:hypothetical protein